MPTGPHAHSRPKHYRSTAWPLAVGYALLIAYASLYPFSGWRVTAEPWYLYLLQWPKYWLRFDVISNFLGYVPLGFLAAASVLSHRPKARNWPWLLLIALGCALWSFFMESTQNYLPWRVPSLADLLLNSAGGAGGVLLARMALALGLIERWKNWRERSMLPHSRGVFVLLFLWPFALLFPSQHPFGLGQFLGELENFALQTWPQHLWLQTHLPLPRWLAPDLNALLQSLSVCLGLLLPMGSMALLLRRRRSRALGQALVLAVGVLMLGLAFALSYDPQHAWLWATPAVYGGIGAAAVLGLLNLWTPRLWLAIGLLLALLLQSLLLNFSPISSYTHLEMQTWKQGEFVRFYGLSEWLAWLWPYALAAVLLLFIWRLWHRDQDHGPHWDSRYQPLA